MIFLFVTAFKDEFAPLKKYFKLGGIPDKSVFLEKEEGKNTFLFSVTGVGKKNVGKFFSSFDKLSVKPDKIFFAGVCGAVDKSLQAGDVIFPRAVLSQRFERLSLYGGGGGMLYTADKFLKKSDKEAVAFKKNGIKAVDMESFWIVKGFFERGINDVVVVKGVSDSLDMYLPDGYIVSKYYENLPMLLKEFFSRRIKMKDFVAILKLKKNIKTASENAAAFALNLLPDLR